MVINFDSMAGMIAPFINWQLLLKCGLTQFVLNVIFNFDTSFLISQHSAIEMTNGYGPDMKKSGHFVALVEDKGKQN